jgi:hypothetical protein
MEKNCNQTLIFIFYWNIFRQDLLQVKVIIIDFGFFYGYLILKKYLYYLK